MYSYMEGAIESGIRAALEVLNFIKPQSLTPQELKVNIMFLIFLIFVTKQKIVPFKGSLIYS